LYKNNVVKYVRYFAVYNTLITEYMSILYRSIDVLDMMFSDGLSNTRMDLVGKPIECDRE